MIKELDKRGQEKVTPRKLFNEESGEARSENSQMSPSAEEVKGYSSDGFSSGSEDLSIPYRQPKPMPFTSRITRFRYHRRGKLSPNVRMYEGNKDPEDHLSIFFAVAEQEEWPMLVWCTMFYQTLGSSTRNWFDSLDPKSVDGFEELSKKFLEEFSQHKRYDKDPTEIHGIKRNPNEGLQVFMDRFKAERAHIKGVPSTLRISHSYGYGHLELAKKLNDNILKIVDEMWERVRAFIRGETAADTTKVIRSPRGGKSAGKARWSENQNGSRNKGHRRGEGRSIGTCAPYARREGFTPLTKTLKEIFAMDNVNFPPPPPMVGTPEKRNMNKFCDCHQD
ncbi:reverse transcriptase domain-containing protein [Tanacetum coccineum]